MKNGAQVVNYQQKVQWMDFLERVRIAHVLPLIRGNLLDLACGFNNLVRMYGSGVGVDVYPWPGIDVMVGDSAFLPFPPKRFDTVTILAALNHMPNRCEVLAEIRRVLVDDGRLIVTMIGPLTGKIAHVLFTRDEKTRGGMREGEKSGMTKEEIESLLQTAGFVLQESVTFEFHLNRVYVAAKATT